MRNNATDNARFLFLTISNLLDGWNGRRPAVPKSYAEAPRLSVSDKGQYLFATRCAACHTIGHGIFIGPDLLGVTDTRDRNWLARFIQKPDQMLADKDPLAMALFKQSEEVQDAEYWRDLKPKMIFAQRQRPERREDRGRGKRSEKVRLRPLAPQ